MNSPQASRKQSDCLNWEDGCLLGYHGGKPTEEDCASCMDYRGNPRGLGDHVANTIKFVKLKKPLQKIAEAVSGKDVDGKRRGCGCGKRRAALNKMLPSRD